MKELCWDRNGFCLWLRPRHAAWDSTPSSASAATSCHQQHSEPQMKKNRAWIRGVFSARRLEPTRRAARPSSVSSRTGPSWSKLTLRLIHTCALNNVNALQCLAGHCFPRK